MVPSPFAIESCIPKPWEEASSFHDVLYEWMDRAPWIGISIAAHLLAYFILAAIPWAEFGSDRGVKIQARLEEAPTEVLEDPEEIVPEELVEDSTEDPVLQNADIVEQTEEDAFDSDEGLECWGDPVIDQDLWAVPIGIGGSPSGKFGQRGLGHRGLKARGGSGIEQSLADALEWLKSRVLPASVLNRQESEGQRRHVSVGRRVPLLHDGAQSSASAAGATRARASA